jgi:hypothetical protein
MTYNPFEEADRKVQKAKRDFALGLGIVTAVPDDVDHQIVMKEITDVGDGGNGPTGSTVMVPQRGDIALPSRGDMIVFGRLKNGEPLTLGTIYSREAPSREYAANERHIGADDGGGTYLHGPFGVVPKVTDDPQNAVDGAVWYRTDIDEYRGQEDGNTVTFDTTTV